MYCRNIIKNLTKQAVTVLMLFITAVVFDVSQVSYATAADYNVNNEIQLAEALEGNDKDVAINLTSSIEFKGIIEFDESRNVTINLNSNGLTVEANGEFVILVKGGANLTINGPGTLVVRNNDNSKLACVIMVDEEDSTLTIKEDAAVDLRNRGGFSYHDAYILASNKGKVNITGDIVGCLYASDNGISTIDGNVSSRYSSGGHINAANGGVVIVNGNVGGKIDAVENGEVTINGDVENNVNASSGGVVTITGNISNAVNASESGIISITGTIEGNVIGTDNSIINIIGNVTRYRSTSMGNVYCYSGSKISITGNIGDYYGFRDAYAYEDSSIIVGGNLSSAYAYGGEITIHGDVRYRTIAESMGKIYIYGDLPSSINNVITIGKYPSEVVHSPDAPVRENVELPEPHNNYFWDEFSDEEKDPSDGVSYVYKRQGSRVTGVSISKPEALIYIGDTETLSVAIEPADAINKSVIWSSSNENIATVDENGRIVAISEGLAIITVTTEDGSHISTCDITVESKIYRIELNENTELMFGELVEGYQQPDTLEIMITNSGTHSTGLLTITLSGEDAAFFTLSKSTIADIDVNKNERISITPKSGLGNGLYTATVEISGDNELFESFSVNLTVLPAIDDITLISADDAITNNDNSDSGYIVMIIISGLVLLAGIVIGTIVIIKKKKTVAIQNNLTESTGINREMMVVDENVIDTDEEIVKVYCSSCGKEIIGDAKFCIQCGQRRE